MRKWFPAVCLIFCLSLPAFSVATDTVFYQPVSEKAMIHESLRGARLKKVVVDYNNVAFVLTDKGVGRLFDNQIIKDLLYRPLQNRIPVDIAVQDSTGFLYYLYDDELLTNARAGEIRFELPSKTYSTFQVGANGSVLLKGNQKLTLIENGKQTDIKMPADPIRAIYVHRNTFYALMDDGIHVLKNGRLQELHRKKQIQDLAFRDSEIIIATRNGYYAIDDKTGKETFSIKTKIPIQNVKHLAIAKNNIWAGTNNGAFMERQSKGYDYYASKRWLIEDSVIGIAAGKKNDLYFLNSTGLSKIQFRPFTYHEKAEYFQDKIRDRHIRYGLLAELRLKTPGDLSTAEMVDKDNDGLWSSFYLGSQAFRYAVTGEEIARDHVWETFEAFERLISINPLKGFPSRTFERTGFKVSDPNKWRPGNDTTWEWKGTTSSDEFVGYIFIAALMDQFVAKTKEEKKRVADFMDQILTHIIENNYNFVDIDGKHTLWGRWHPDYINSYAKTISDRKLGSTHLIAGLQLGYALTGKKIYKDEAFRMMNDHGYLENILLSPFNIKATDGYFYEGIDMGTGPWNHSDDEMEFLSYWVLHHYAFDKDLQKQYGTAIKEFWQIELPEKHPVWNLITYGTEGSIDKESTLWYLREFPMDLIRWDFKNSIRKDLDFLPENFRRQYITEVLSPRERPANRYNANEFTLDGGQGGQMELTGAEYLLPYWMARYFGFIE